MAQLPLLLENESWARGPKEVDIRNCLATWRVRSTGGKMDRWVNAKFQSHGCAHCTPCGRLPRCAWHQCLGNAETTVRIISCQSPWVLWLHTLHTLINIQRTWGCHCYFLIPCDFTVLTALTMWGCGLKMSSRKRETSLSRFTTRTLS
jgi:hypothetical protein